MNRNFNIFVVFSIILISSISGNKLQAQEFFLDSISITYDGEVKKESKYKYDEDSKLKSIETGNLIHRYSYINDLEYKILTSGIQSSVVTKTIHTKKIEDGRLDFIRHYELDDLNEEKPTYSYQVLYDSLSRIDQINIQDVYTIQYYEGYYPHSTRFFTYNSKGLIHKDSTAYYTGGYKLKTITYNSIDQKEREIVINFQSDEYIDSIWFQWNADNEISRYNSTFWVNGNLDRCDSAFINSNHNYTETILKFSWDCEEYNNFIKKDTFFSSSPFLLYDSLRNVSLTSDFEISKLYNKSVFSVDTSQLSEGKYSTIQTDYKYNSFYDNFEITERFKLYTQNPETTAIEEPELTTYNFNFFPNPASTSSYISINDPQKRLTEYKIFNQIGELITKGKFIKQTTTQTIKSPDISGVYFIRLGDSQTYVTEKILVLD